MRMLLSTLALALVVGLAPTLAEAACTKTGTIVRVKMRNDGKSGNHVIYVREFTTDFFYWTAKTTDDEMAVLAGSLVANRTRVRIKGNVSSCGSDPSAGSFKTLGKVIDLFVSP